MSRPFLRTALSISGAVLAPKAATESQREKGGWKNVKLIFTQNEFGELSPQLSTITQCSLYSTLMGCVYGGFVHSREAYLSFIERNEASKFTNHFEAQKSLQDFVAVNFAKGAFKWGWRIGAFGAIYISFVTVCGTYRGDWSIFDFITAGCLTGGIFRINYGLNGVIVGATLGTMMGLFAGAMSSFLFRISGTNLEDIYSWQNENYLDRKKLVANAFKDYRESGMNKELFTSHDLRLNEKKPSDAP